MARNLSLRCATNSHINFISYSTVDGTQWEWHKFPRIFSRLQLKEYYRALGIRKQFHPNSDSSAQWKGTLVGWLLIAARSCVARDSRLQFSRFYNTFENRFAFACDYVSHFTCSMLASIFVFSVVILVFVEVWASVWVWVWVVELSIYASHTKWSLAFCSYTHTYTTSRHTWNGYGLKCSTSYEARCHASIKREFSSFAARRHWRQQQHSTAMLWTWIHKFEPEI